MSTRPFIRLRQNTLLLATGMKGKVNRAEARKSEGGLGCGAILLRYPVTPWRDCGGLHYLNHVHWYIPAPIAWA